MKHSSREIAKPLPSAPVAACKDRTTGPSCLQYITKCELRSRDVSLRMWAALQEANSVTQYSEF